MRLDQPRFHLPGPDHRPVSWLINGAAHGLAGEGVKLLAFHLHSHYLVRLTRRRGLPRLRDLRATSDQGSQDGAFAQRPALRASQRPATPALHPLDRGGQATAKRLFGKASGPAKVRTEYRVPCRAAPASAQPPPLVSRRAVFLNG